MIRAACHCTDVRLEIDPAPTWVAECNCTICRRYGAMWAYYKPGQVRVVRGADSTDTYLWNDKAIAFHRCRTCGCITHMADANADSPHIFGVNARMMPTLDPAKVSVRHLDNSHSGFFWTESSEPPRPSHHPKMPPPGPEDWR